MGIDSTLIETLVNAQSMGTSFNSNPVEISNETGYAVECDWTGGSTNSSADMFLVEGSVGGTNFVTVASAPMNTTTGSILINVEFARYRFFRVAFTQSTATVGTFSVFVSGKS